MSKRFLQSNLKTIMSTAAIRARFVNNAMPGTEAYRTRQRAIEDELARRIAIIHNAGSGGTSVNIGAPGYVLDYASEFMGAARRGDWRSLRCSDELDDRKELQMQNAKSEVTTMKHFLALLVAIELTMSTSACVHAAPRI